VALHFRQAPQVEAAATSLAQQLADSSAGRLRLQRGKMVVEIVPTGSDKGGAIAALLDEGDLLVECRFSPATMSPTRLGFAVSMTEAASPSALASGRVRRTTE
jgi:trehalose-phosphatase